MRARDEACFNRRSAPSFPTRVHAPDRRFRLRITAGDAIALGPGRVALLEAIDRTGSINAALAAHRLKRPTPMHIETDDLRRPAVQALLEEHLASMRRQSPACSVHALDLERLRHPSISFWTAWDGDRLLGCAALKALGPTHGELKSMRTPEALRRRGAGRALLEHVVAVARSRGYSRLSLETGSPPAFAPAHRLYAQAGFVPCEPFEGYVADPNSVFLTLAL